MPRQPLPPEARRVQVRITLSPAAEAALDALARARTGGNRSALVEALVTAEEGREERRQKREGRA